MDIGGIVLFKILENPSDSLESWTKIKNVYFSGEYSSIYSSIAKFYDKNSYLPCFNELTISIRDGLTKSKIIALSKLEPPPDVPIELAVVALTNEFAQSEALTKIDKFVDNVHLLDSEEIKSEIADILLYLEEKTHSSETICTMKDITLLNKEDTLKDLIPLGFNNSFDSNVRIASTELLMIGGKVGSGKSIVSTNIVVNQYNQGNVGLYFSIEMRSREVFNRILSIGAGVSAQRLRFGNLTVDEYDKLALFRKDMFVDSNNVYEEYLETKNFADFENNLITKKLNPTNQIIIIDNQSVSLADIDMGIQKYKAQFGDKLKVVTIDYINQISIPDIYSWQSQISLSKGLKDIGRKYDVTMITPYQINEKGEARFARGVLDAADMAITLDTGENYISFDSLKTRGTDSFKISSGMDWDTLRIDPVDIKIEVSPEEEETKETNYFKQEDNIPF